MARRGRKGAEATAKKLRGGGLDPRELPELHTLENAKEWLALIGAAVVTKRLDARDAQAGIRAVEAWLKAEGERATAEVLDELRAEIDRVKSDMAARSIKAV